MGERDAIVAVTEADREAAAGAMSNVWATGSSHSDFMRILDGRLDQHWSVQAFARHRATHAGEAERLREEIADLKSSVIAFGAPWAGQYARDFGFPPNHLHATHYDILEKAGARMDSFVRHDPQALEASR